MDSGRNMIIGRILERLDCPDLQGKFDNLSPSDANSLFMALYSRLSARLDPQDILKNYAHNRYASPSDSDPLEHHALALELLTLGKAAGFKPTTLSPAALLGSCSALAPVSQNKIISATRGTELLSDPTNMLALHIASGLKDGSLSHGEDGIHFCVAERVTRVAASFPKGFYPHFGVFCLVSAGQDSGSYAFERAVLRKHLALHLSFLQQRGIEDVTLAMRKRGGYPDSSGFFAAMESAVREAFPAVEMRTDDSDFDNPYYRGINIKYYTSMGGGPVELGDMGFVDWTQKLLGGRKERMFISAMGMERLHS